MEHKPRKVIKHSSAELILAKKKHKVMKCAFKGVMSYPTRKILFKVGKHNGG